MTQSSPWWSERSPVDLAHVLVADALTSAGLMLWQGEFTACLFVTSSWSASRTPGVGVGKQGEQCAGFGNANSLLAKPIAIALPFWIRLWQCVAQARHAAKTKARPSGHVSSSARDSSTLHLLNAVKYASCLAVIGCSVCIQMAELDGIRRGVGAWHGTFWNVSEDAWWKTWICLLCLKTAFTFAWDVVVDWGLARVGCDGRAARVGCLCPCCDDGLDSDMDTDGGGGDSDDERDSGDADAAGDSPAPGPGPGAPNRRPRRYPPFLRKELLFVKPAKYYAAVAFNLVGRTTWGLAISPHVCEGACVLSLGIVELVRRAAWTLLRVENEVIRTHAERRRRRRLGIRNAERYARAFRNSPLNRSRRVSSVTSLGDRDAGAGVARVVRRDARVALNAPLFKPCCLKRRLLVLHRRCTPRIAVPVLAAANSASLASTRHFSGCQFFAFGRMVAKVRLLRNSIPQKNTASNAPLGASTAIPLPTAPPSAVPAASAAPILKSTFPSARCCKSATAEGGSIASRLVPNTAACGRGDTSARSGVTIVPPPMPRRPDARPAVTPMAASFGAASTASNF